VHLFHVPAATRLMISAALTPCGSDHVCGEQRSDCKLNKSINGRLCLLPVRLGFVGDIFSGTQTEGIYTLARLALATIRYPKRWV
jgi:hypothetical protein